MNLVDFQKYNKAISTVVAIGKFDGIHKGHQKLLEKAVSISKTEKLSSVAYSIMPKETQDILSISEKEKILHSIGIEYQIDHVMTKDFMSMTPVDFVEKILVNTLNARHVVVGYNFRFGYKRLGNAQILKELCKERNVSVTVIPCVYFLEDNKKTPISSSKIKELLADGKVDSAQNFLGRYYSIKGCVEEGKKLGRTLGFPTANIYIKDNFCMLKHGVYITRVCIQDRYYMGITNVGVNPTVDSDQKIKTETYIINFDKDIYNKNVKLEFIRYLRDEQKFNSVENLKEQINKDKIKALEMLRSEELYGLFKNTD